MMVTPNEEVAYLIMSGESETSARCEVASALYATAMTFNGNVDTSGPDEDRIRRRAGRIAAIEAAKRHTCATCRFMSPEPDDLELWDDKAEDTVPAPHHACLRIIHVNGSSGHGIELLTEPALTKDGSGYSARLIVMPTFSCALHEAKP